MNAAGRPTAETLGPLAFRQTELILWEQTELQGQIQTPKGRFALVMSVCCRFGACDLGGDAERLREAGLLLASDTRRA